MRLPRKKNVGNIVETTNIKKAIVTLSDGDVINLFTEN
jgi:ribosomal protein L23